MEAQVQCTLISEYLVPLIICHAQGRGQAYTHLESVRQALVTRIMTCKDYIRHWLHRKAIDLDNTITCRRPYSKGSITHQLNFTPQSGMKAPRSIVNRSTERIKTHFAESYVFQYARAYVLGTGFAGYQSAH
jgi:hypothetical protein